MPAGYAHFIFGREVLRLLPEDKRTVIENNIHLYDIGLHGPDVTFYFRPASGNPVSDEGNDIHNHSGLDFFGHAKKVLSDNASKPEDRAFLYGYLCHFALDSAAHGYVNQRVTDTGVPHCTTEAEFDRYLMEKDHVYCPATHFLAPHIKPSKKAAAVMYKYYKHMSEAEALESLVSMRIMLRLLIMPGRTLRKAVLPLFDKIGGAAVLVPQLVVPYESDPKVAEANEELEHRLYDIAVPRAVKLITEFDDIVQNKLEWSGEYLLKFDPEGTDDESFPEGRISE